MNVVIVSRLWTVDSFVVERMCLSMNVRNDFCEKKGTRTRFTASLPLTFRCAHCRPRDFFPFLVRPKPTWRHSYCCCCYCFAKPSTQYRRRPSRRRLDRTLKLSTISIGNQGRHEFDGPGIWPPRRREMVEEIFVGVGRSLCQMEPNHLEVGGFGQLRHTLYRWTAVRYAEQR